MKAMKSKSKAMKNKVVKKALKTKFGRLGPHLRGEIWGLHQGGFSNPQIAAKVVKPDGTHPSKDAVRDALALRRKMGPRWDGVVQPPRAGPRKTTTDKLDKDISKLVFKHRGKAKVDRAYIRKMIKAARKVSASTISRRLAVAGLAWLRRRRKTLVPAAHKVARIDFNNWVLRCHDTTLERWVYSDGTTWFLAKGWDEFEAGQQRAALGPHVWRMADGSDGLFEDCVGPSSYAKAQGIPVRVWGLLANGVLYVAVLPAGKWVGGNGTPKKWIGGGMTIDKYVKMIDKFRKWIDEAFWPGAKTFLAQDGEKCLWNDKCISAMNRNGISVLKEFPKSSQDLNAIEVAWRELKARLHQTQPASLETRESFIRRLRNGVAWVNKHRAGKFLRLCQEQKKRAREVIKMKGARIKDPNDNDDE